LAVVRASGAGDSDFSNMTASHNFRVRDADDLLSFRRQLQIDRAGWICAAEALVGSGLAAAKFFWARPAGVLGRPR